MAYRVGWRQDEIGKTENRLNHIEKNFIHITSRRERFLSANPLCYSLGIADQPWQMPIAFYGLVGYDWVRFYSLWLKRVVISDQIRQYPRCIPDASTFKSRYSRPTSVFPVDQFPLCTTKFQPIPDLSTLATFNKDQTPIRMLDISDRSRRKNSSKFSTTIDILILQQFCFNKDSTYVAYFTKCTKILTSLTWRYLIFLITFPTRKKGHILFLKVPSSPTRSSN